MTIMGGTIRLVTPKGAAGARFRLDFSTENPVS
jgi:hypothetical protein